MSTKTEYISPSPRLQAFNGTLPFLVFGIVSLIDKVNQFYAPRFTSIYLVFYGLALTGLLFGWIRRFPLWSYSYLGWSLVFAWWWTNISINGINWGYRVWLPFGITVLLAFLWTRSLQPIKKFLSDVWNDWSRLSLAMFTLGSWTFLIFDENHHPYLPLFILATTLAASAGAWFFLRSASLLSRVISIITSFIGVAVITGISYATWDWRAYYGLPPSDQVLNNLGLAPIGVLLWLLILFWPAWIALARRLLNH